MVQIKYLDLSSGVNVHFFRPLITHEQLSRLYRDPLTLGVVSRSFPPPMTFRTSRTFDSGSSSSRSRARARARLGFASELRIPRALNSSHGRSRPSPKIEINFTQCVRVAASLFKYREAISYLESSRPLASFFASHFFSFLSSLGDTLLVNLGKVARDWCMYAYNFFFLPRYQNF